MNDLNQAAELLAGFDAGSNKDQIDEAVVYGLRARANLLMQTGLPQQKMQTKLFKVALRNLYRKFPHRPLIRLLPVHGYGGY